MDANTIASWGALLVAIIGAVAAVYINARKRLSEEKLEDLTANREDREVVVKQWKDYATNLIQVQENLAAVVEQRHKGDIAKLEEKNKEQDREIAFLLERERECQIKFTSAQTKIVYLEEQIDGLRQLVESLKLHKS